MEVQPAIGQLQEEVGEPPAHSQESVAQGRLEAERDVVAFLSARVHLRKATFLQRHCSYLMKKDTE